MIQLRKATIAELVLLGVVFLLIVIFVAEKTLEGTQATSISVCTNTTFYTFNQQTNACQQTTVCGTSPLASGQYPTCEACVAANPTAVPTCSPNNYFVAVASGSDSSSSPAYVTCQAGPNSILKNYANQPQANNPEDLTVTPVLYDGYTDSECTIGGTVAFDFNEYNTTNNIGVQCDPNAGFSICSPSSSSSSSSSLCIPLTSDSLNKSLLPYQAVQGGKNNLDPTSYQNLCIQYTKPDCSSATPTCTTSYFWENMTPDNTYVPGTTCSCPCYQVTPNFIEYNYDATDGGFKPTAPQFSSSQSYYQIDPNNNSNAPNKCPTSETGPNPPSCPSPLVIATSGTNINTCCADANLTAPNCGNGTAYLDINPSNAPVDCKSSPNAQNTMTQIAFSDLDACQTFANANYSFTGLNPGLGIYCDLNNGITFCELNSTSSTKSCTGYTGKYVLPADVQIDTNTFPCMPFCDNNSSNPQATVYWLTNDPNNPVPAGYEEQGTCDGTVNYVCTPNGPNICAIDTTGKSTLTDCSTCCAANETYCSNSKNEINSVCCAAQYSINNPNVCTTDSSGNAVCDTSKICGINSVYSECNYIQPKYIYNAAQNQCVLSTSSPTVTYYQAPSGAAVCIDSQQQWQAANLQPCASTDNDCIYQSNQWPTYTLNNLMTYLNSVCSDDCNGPCDIGQQYDMFYDFANVCVDSSNNYNVTSSTDVLGVTANGPSCMNAAQTPSTLSNYYKTLQSQEQANFNLAISKVINTGSLPNLPSISYFTNNQNRQKFETNIASQVSSAIC